jgi:hypothetical protein
MTRRHARRTAGLLAALFAVTVVAAAQGAPTTTVTPAQLKSGFKKATGQKLVVDRGRSSTGRYTAFNLGVQTKTRQDRYGTFTIYLVTSADAASDVESLLRDPHTGEVGTPAPGGIYWEQDVTMTGQQVWMAKHQYGPNLVLWWTSTNPTKKTDRTYATLNKALKGIVGHK